MMWQGGSFLLYVKKIRLKGDKPLFVIGIIEHESEINYNSSFKLLQYITYILSDYVKENDKNRIQKSSQLEANH